MFSSPTTIYRSGSRSIEVLPGESHSDAWGYVVRGGLFPARYPCSHDPHAVRIRRHAHHSSRRREHRRAALAAAA